VGAEASGIASVSAHKVKWSFNTSIQLLPLPVVGMGPTRSMAITCHGRPAWRLRLLAVSVECPCLLAWHISHFRTRSWTSRVIPGQYHWSWRHRVTLPAPEWACLWVSQINSRRRANGRTTLSHSRWFAPVANVIVNNPSPLNWKEFQRSQKYLNSAHLTRCSASIVRRSSFLTRT